jgi:alpha-tubulin suppressor-like RCC1 family protein/outer membrane protein assembly factor BamB
MKIARSFLSLTFALFALATSAEETTNIVGELWPARTMKPRLSSPALSADQTVVWAGGSDGVLYGFYTENGEDFTNNVVVGGGRLSAPLIAGDGTIYVATSGGVVYAIEDPKVSGQILWRFPKNHSVDGGFVGSPVIDDDGVLYIGARDNQLYAIDTTEGTLIWKFRATRDVTGSPTITSGGNIVFPAGNTIVTLSPDGTELATFTAGSTIRSTPAVANGAIYFGAKDDIIYSTTGAGSSGGTKVTNSVVQTNAVVTTNGSVLVTNIVVSTNNVVTTNSTGLTGITWQVDGGADIFSSPAVGVSGRVYIGTDNRRVFCIETNGTVRWKASLRGAVKSDLAIGADGTVLAGTEGKALYGLNPQTGEQKWKFMANGPVRCSPVIASDGTVYITVGKTLHAIDPGDDFEIDEAPWPQFRKDAQHTARATLDVISITEQPQDVTTNAGSTVVFKVVASAGSALTFQWTFNGSNIAGATTSTLTFTNVQFTNSGTYAVKVSSATTSVFSSNAVLTVVSAPVITTGLTNHFISAGSDLHLEVSAMGSPPMTAQWFSNGVAITAATNLFYDITNAQASSSPVAYVIAVSNTNSADHPTTSTALVTIVSLELRPSAGISIAAGNRFSAAVISNQLFTWGADNVGQLGDGNTTTRVVPTRTSTETNWLFVSAGGRGNATLTNGHALAIRTDGLFSWGANAQGQLGVGNNIGSLLPTIISIDTNWVIAEAGAQHSAALRGDGTIWTWGGNEFGQLGIGNTTNQNAPMRVGVDSAWVEVRAGGSFTLARRADGTIWGWGRNDFAQLGTTNGGSNVLSPKQIGTNMDWATISAGVSHAMGIRSNGTLWVWGRNFGQSGATRYESPTNYFRQLVQLGDATNWVSVDAGSDHSLIINNAGEMFAWGADQVGQLGNGTSGTASATNSANAGTPLQIGTNRTWAAAEAGVRHSIARASDNTIWAWGWNEFGQVGDGTTTNRNLPVLLSFTNFVAAPTNTAQGPIITQQPSNTTAGVGGTASFNVSATGTQPLFVQWLFNSNAISSASVPSATNFTLVLTNVQPTNAGTYHALITNSFGMAASTVATLTVTNTFVGDTNETTSPPVPRMAIAPTTSTNGVTIPVSDSSSTQQLVLEFKALMSDPAWTPLTTNQGSSAVTNLLDPTPPTNSSRFYRVRVR